jgi:hypothetical protein
MAKPHHEIVRVAGRAFSEALKMPLVLERAKISRTTWWRIRKTGMFHSSTIANIDRAIDELVAEREKQGNSDGPQAES